jgi:ACS family tartrate transporter-like MFS transporter
MAMVVDEESLMNQLRWRLIPWTMFLFMITMVDRVNIGYAALGMNKELGIGMTWFGTIAGIFFISYFLCEIPSNLILHRVGARIWIARIMISWGIVTFFTGFVQNITHLVICRFLLGAMEAGMFPGLILYFTYWFPAKHSARPVAFMMTGNAIASALGGPFATWLLDHVHGFGLAGWRWIFLVEGTGTVVVGVLCLFILVDRPQNAKFLSENEKQWLTARLAAEHKAKAKVMSISKWGALKNGWIWYFIACYFGGCAGLYLVFFWMPQILKRLSSLLTNTQVGLLSSIPYVCAVISMTIVSRHSDKTGERRWHAALGFVVTAFAFIGLTLTHSIALNVVFLCLAACGLYNFTGIFFAVATAVLGEASAAVGIALINCVGNLGSFAGPFLYGLTADLTHSTVAGTYLIAGLVLTSAVLLVCIPKRYERAATIEPVAGKGAAMTE